MHFMLHLATLSHRNNMLTWTVCSCHAVALHPWSCG